LVKGMSIQAQNNQTANVGINNSNPAYSLDVVGTGNFSQTLTTNGLTCNSNTTLPSSFNTPTTGQLGYLASTTGYNITVTSANSPNTWTNFNSVSLGVGRWLIIAQPSWTGGATGTCSSIEFGLSTSVSGSLTYCNYCIYSTTNISSASTFYSISFSQVVTVATAPTVYYCRGRLVTNISYSTSTDNSTIQAIRIA